MKRLFATAALIALPGLASAQSADIPQDTVDAIMAKLAEMQCEMDPGDIEAEEDGYDLDDVFCADGQYDIELNADLEETGRRKE